MTRVTHYRRVKDIDEKLSEVQDAVADSFNSIVNKQILAGRVADVIIPAGLSVVYPHRLGRNLVGWIIIDKNAAADVYRTNKDSPNLFLNLTASAPVTLKLWVF